MKTILITTDFSSASRNACFYGVKLAKLIGAKVVLLNVYPIIFPTVDTAIMITEQELDTYAKERLSEEATWLNVNGSVAIEKRCEQGNAAEVILAVAKQVKASWIFAGLKGATTITRKIFGGTAYSLSRHSDIPLILVPEYAWFKAPKVIALASDISDENALDILHPLKEFGEQFSATMFIVRVIKKGMNDVLERLLKPARLQWYCKELHPTYEFLNDNDVTHAMNEFVKEHNVDVVAMISKEHNLLERIFVKSNIKQMIIQSQVPLMILPGKKSDSMLAEAKVSYEEGSALVD